MKIVLAPNGFKECLPAGRVADCLEEGIGRVLPRAELVKVPMADGGDGTARALVEATEGELVEQTVTGPLGEAVEACLGILGDGRTAVIEMAQASGLRLIAPQRRNPLFTTTYGTGELIRVALDRGATNIVVGIGGSATVDGGAGMAQALGARLLDDRGEDIPFGGGNLGRLRRIDVATLDARLGSVSVLVASDVDNLLTGPQGASSVYGPQKGATPEMVTQLEANLSHYAEIIRRDLGVEVRTAPGGGAAGGLGAGLVAFLRAEIRPGVEVVIEISEFEEKVKGADLVITGEGKIDGQTPFGKAPVGVARVAKQHGIPVIAVAGWVADDARVVLDHGIDAIFSVTKHPMSLEEAMEAAPSLVSDLGEQIARLLRLGRLFRQKAASPLTKLSRPVNY